MKPSTLGLGLLSFVSYIALVLALSVDRPCLGADRLNVLFVAVDDLRPELGCYGVPVVKSPNIDRLASQGLLFNRAYCQQAVCNSSRASLLTSLRPETTEVFQLSEHFRDKVPDAVTVAQHFKAQAYFSQSFGKIFHTGHGNRDDAMSWSTPSYRPGATASANKPAGTAPRSGVANKKKAGKKGQGKTAAKKDGNPPYAAPDVPDSELGDGQIADHAIEFLHAHENEPFFLAVGFLKPHLPFIAPKKYWDFYDRDQIAMAPNPFHPKDTPLWTGNNSGELRAYSDIPDVGPVSPEQARALKHGYYACVSFMDAQLGRVINELERLKLRDKTIVVLWGDHGWQLGEHAMWCKHTDYETSTRAPLIISVPGQKNQGAKTDALVEFVDIFPSLVDLCGLPMPKGLEGISFKPLLDNPARPWKKAVFSVWPKNVPEQGEGMGWAIRTDRYRLVEWRVPATGFVFRELYDHQTDPQENQNIAARPENAALVAELSAQLRAGWKAALPPDQPMPRSRK